MHETTHIEKAHKNYVPEEMQYNVTPTCVLALFNQYLRTFQNLVYTPTPTAFLADKPTLPTRRTNDNTATILAFMHSTSIRASQRSPSTDNTAQYAHHHIRPRLC
ncbi:unnamed protein product [Arctia plantaginis]|uniref:Uncharacterized protein n=1 Tax=Arctia plantaginis TaxID=874455 RepID=A0A8S1ATB2_ARCPL|nr:unnamed protein product [Arctia plantaginis]